MVQKLAEDVRAKSGCGQDWRVLNVLHRVASQVIRLHFASYIKAMNEMNIET